MSFILKILLLVFGLTSFKTREVKSAVITEWLSPGSKIEFGAKEIPHHFLLNRLNWAEKNERSTSKNYTLWDEADLYLLEWPGNVTLFSQDNPVVKWGRKRAKYIEDRCGAQHTGGEMRAYAYNYVYLTWGPYRLTNTYSPPLTVPKSVLPFTTVSKLSQNNNFEPNKINSLVAFDIAFTYDTLLLAYSCGIIRVSGLEMNWAELSSTPTTPLKYSVSKGIQGTIDKIVVQDCCLKTDYCSFGNVVVAYRQYSIPHRIYISYDGGENFKKLSPMEHNSGHLRVVLSYPEINSLLIVHGNGSDIKVTQGIVHPGLAHYYSQKSALYTFQTSGEVQGNRIGMDMSFILWDKCNVWYTSELGSNGTKALFYMNKLIANNADKHSIVSEMCSFGKTSALAYGTNGRFGILDSNNVFFMGVDSKSSISQLVALKVDMSLLIPGTENSIYPYFDLLEQPKLLYPPKFLQLPKMLNMGKSYERRLGMRLLPKNVYPSDFILSFYEENAKLKTEEKMYALRVCETSTLSVNNSITQRKKYYSIGRNSFLNFTITFTSRSNSLRQLKFEPLRALKFFRVSIRPVSIDVVESEKPRYFIKHRIVIKPSTSSVIGKVFKVNFYTKSSLRCLQQPRVSVYIKVEEKLDFVPPHVSDDDMSQRVYLKSVGSSGETTYLSNRKIGGETLQKNVCPLSLAQKRKLDISK